MGGPAAALQLHPLNTAFTWRSPRAPFRRLTAEQARQYDEQGFVLLADALPEQVVARARAEIDALEEQTVARLRSVGGRDDISDVDSITFSAHLVTRSKLLRQLAASAPFTELAHDLVGPQVRLYWDQAVYKKPEKPRAFPWHQDNGYTFVEPQQYLTCWVALTDATEDNGCPRVVPGLHRMGTLRHWRTEAGWQCLEEPVDGIPVPARAGSIVVFSSLTPHLTGPNLTTDVRKAYILQYAADGTRTVGRGTASDAEQPVVQNDPARQFLVVPSGIAEAPHA